VLVVDDESTDGTGEVADRLAAECPDVTVIHRPGPRGFGPALAEGFRLALARGSSAILTMDADFSHDPADIPRLLAALPGADVVIGSRYAPGGQIRAWSFYRRLLSASANWFVRILFLLPALDCTSGFRVYQPELLELMPWDEFHSTGYSFLVEMLYFAARAGRRRFREVPICFVDRRAGTSKMGWREIVLGAANLLKLRLRRLGRR
jgi:glycosyltransferase involved in cell wall biosynthesis